MTDRLRWSLFTLLLAGPTVMALAQGQHRILERPVHGQAILDSLWRFFDADDSAGLYIYLGQWAIVATQTAESKDSLRDILTDVYRQDLAQGIARRSPFSSPFSGSPAYVAISERLLFVDCTSRAEWDMHRVSLSASGRIDTLRNFRPSLIGVPRPVLAVSRELAAAMTAFLNGYRLQQSRYSDPPTPIADRIGFLRKFCPVGTGHWGHYYHFTSIPICWRIELSPDHCEAKVSYNDSYYSGSIRLYRRNRAEWTSLPLESYPSWIE